MGQHPFHHSRGIDNARHILQSPPPRPARRAYAAYQAVLSDSAFGHAAGMYIQRAGPMELRLQRHSTAHMDSARGQRREHIRQLPANIRQLGTARTRTHRRRHKHAHSQVHMYGRDTVGVLRNAARRTVHSRIPRQSRQIGRHVPPRGGNGLSGIYADDL